MASSTRPQHEGNLPGDDPWRWVRLQHARGLEPTTPGRLPPVGASPDTPTAVYDALSVSSASPGNTSALEAEQDASGGLSQAQDAPGGVPSRPAGRSGRGVIGLAVVVGLALWTAIAIFRLLGAAGHGRPATTAPVTGVSPAAPAVRSPSWLPASATAAVSPVAPTVASVGSTLASPGASATAALASPTRQAGGVLDTGGRAALAAATPALALAQPATVPAGVPTTTSGRAAALVSTPVAASAAAVSSAASGQRSYIVRAGDTLFAISRRHNTTVDALVAANNLPSRDAILSIGQKLTLP